MKTNIFLVCLMAINLAGCATGINNVLFVTRTDVAVDFDTQPPTASIGYKRDELVLAPIDNNGRVLPVLTTVGVSPGIFKFGANHSFATGDAALIFARNLLDDTRIPKQTEINYDTLKSAIDKGLDGNLIDNTGRQRYIFTTNTALGLEVAWTTNNFPNAISLGYKRKEFAFVPITPNQDDTGRSHLASLLATAHSSTNVGGPNDTGMIVGQTFATGFAATLLATHPAIRQAVGPAVVPNWNDAVTAKKAIIEQQKADVKQEKATIKEQNELVSDIVTSFNSPANAASQPDILQAAKELELVDKSTIKDNFPARLRLKIDRTDPELTEKFRQLRSKQP